MLTRSRLRPVSKKRARQKREQSKAYEAAEDAAQSWCSVCGKPGPTEHSHHYSQKHYPEHANDQRNWLIMGKWCGCHRLYENNRAVFAATHPKLWASILVSLADIDPQAFAAFRLKNPF